VKVSVIVGGEAFVTELGAGSADCSRAWALATLAVITSNTSTAPTATTARRIA
jgi:hypothetical protein